MRFLDYFRSKNKGTASIAKERLQIIVAHERSDTSKPADYIGQLQQDIVEVIRKYVNIAQEDVIVSLDRSDSCSVLELNVTLPDHYQPREQKSA